MSEIQNKEGQTNEAVDSAIHIPVVSGFNEPSWDEVVNASIEYSNKEKVNPLIYNVAFMDGVQWMIERQKKP